MEKLKSRESQGQSVCDGKDRESQLETITGHKCVELPLGVTVPSAWGKAERRGNWKKKKIRADSTDRTKSPGALGGEPRGNSCPRSPPPYPFSPASAPTQPPTVIPPQIMRLGWRQGTSIFAVRVFFSGLPVSTFWHIQVMEQDAAVNTKSAWDPSGTWPEFSRVWQSNCRIMYTDSVFCTKIKM